MATLKTGEMSDWAGRNLRHIPKNIPDRFVSLSARYVVLDRSLIGKMTGPTDIEIAAYVMGSYGLSEDATDVDFLKACLAANIALTADGYARLNANEDTRPGGSAPVADDVQTTVPMVHNADTETGKGRDGASGHDGGGKAAKLPFHGTTVSGLEVTVRVDCLNVRLMDSRGFGVDFPWARLHIRLGGPVPHALKALGISDKVNNLIPWPPDLTESTKSRFNAKFRNETGAAGDLLTKVGNTLISNAGRMHWSGETKAGPREERSNQQARIDRTGKEQEQVVCEKAVQDPFFADADEPEEYPRVDYKPSWERERM